MTGLMTWARLLFRQQRWELLLVLVGTAIVVAAMAWYAQQLAAVGATGRACLEAIEVRPGCESVVDQFGELADVGRRLLYFAWAAPFGMGVLLGAPLVAREIDAGTAQLAWSLDGARARWLLRRIGLVVVVALGLLAAVALASELLAASLLPGVDTQNDFALAGRRGWLLVARGSGVLMVGVLVGALLGRVLPAILASALLVGVAFTGVSLVNDGWLTSEAVPVRYMGMASANPLPPGSLYVGPGLETPNGEVITWEEQQRRGLMSQLIDEQGRHYASPADLAAGRSMGWDVQLVVPGERYAVATAREAAVGAGIGLLALAGATLAVRRRRPE